MAGLCIPEKVSLVVFDKDGLLFQSKPFWLALADARIEAARPLMPPALLARWMGAMGVRCEGGGEGLHAVCVDGPGLFATASPAEEIIATATFLAEHTGMYWVAARDAARQVFHTADATLDLQKALVPRQGFPEVFGRLRAAGIPYGIATSDTAARALASMELFGEKEHLLFTISPPDVERGKPDPAMLFLAAARAGGPMGEVAMVGDSLVDVQMAKAAGAIGIGIPETPEAARQMQGTASYILQSLDELLPL